MTWSTADADALDAYLDAHGHAHSTTRPGDVLHDVITAARRALVDVVPEAVRPLVRLALAEVDRSADHVSVTVAMPGRRPLVVLSPAAVADAVELACTIVHECVHVDQIHRVGMAQAVADYALSPESRAQREADAYGAGLWLRYVLTGAVPEAEPLPDLYRLDADAQALAVGVLRSHVATIRAGAVPPLVVCRDAARWLRGRSELPAEIVARIPEVTA